MKASDWVVKPALCCDLDGTVRYNAEDPADFINHATQIAIYPDVEGALWNYRNRGYLILGISNQGGVAFGHKTHQDVDAEILATANAFKRNPFHIIKCSLHHAGGKVEPWNHRSLLRKPDIGMLAVSEVEAFDAGYVINWSESIFVGDRNEDEECASRAGITFRWANDFFGRD